MSSHARARLDRPLAAALLGALLLAWTALGPPRAQRVASASTASCHASAEPREADFACQSHACGCVDAEQCRSSCCCDERLAAEDASELAPRPAPRLVEPVAVVSAAGNTERRARNVHVLDVLRCRGRSQGHAAAPGSGTIACIADCAIVPSANAGITPWRIAVIRVPESARPDPATPPPRAELSRA